MGMADHLLRYRSKSTEALTALQTAYEAQELAFANLTQQSMGTKSFTRDVRLLEEKLQAIAHVLKERGPVVIAPPPINYSTGITDFSGI